MLLLLLSESVSSWGSLKGLHKSRVPRNHVSLPSSLCITLGEPLECRFKTWVFPHTKNFKGTGTRDYNWGKEVWFDWSWFGEILADNHNFLMCPVILILLKNPSHWHQKLFKTGKISPCRLSKVEDAVLVAFEIEFIIRNNSDSFKNHRGWLLSIFKSSRCSSKKSVTQQDKG